MMAPIRDLAGQFLTRRRGQGLRDKTLQNYAYVLGRFEKSFPTWPQDHDAIEDWLGSLELAQESRHDFWRVLRTFFKWASERTGRPNHMLEVPSPRRRKRHPRTLTEAQLQRVFQACRDKTDLGLVALAIDTGARVGEISGLRKLGIGESTVAVDGKTGPREVPVSAEVRRILLGLGDRVHVWTGARGPLTRSGVEQRIRKVLARAGVETPKAGPHLLRHTFGRLYIKNGGNVVKLQRIMGHASIQTTMIYVHMQTEDLVEAHRSVSPVRVLWATPLPGLDQAMKQPF